MCEHLYVLDVMTVKHLHQVLGVSVQEIIGADAQPEQMYLAVEGL